jgi:hypothetical protein
MVENVTVTSISKESITIIWTAATDVETFDVYKNDEWIAKVNETTYTDKGTFAEGIIYTYCVLPVYHTCLVSPACAKAYIEPCIPFDVTNIVATGNQNTKTVHITWDYAGANATFDILKDGKLLTNTDKKNYTDNIEYDITYKYCVKPVAECAGGAAACNTVLIDTPTGITEPITGISIYPNPTKGELSVVSSEYRVQSTEYRVLSIAIFDLMGRNVSRLTSHISHPISIDISHLLSGVYFVRIKTENDVVIRKVVKQ